ncbi:expressed unknown protein [Seminavis robusta]|uniref:Uncharacterized protein n=1 Tax=Seminavis robusta TaxID=568900 RepID=A0A9N8DVL0_9STRA|nr:expressed unknown protein [Seminavis robusta]|eukprot:Sro326_g118080.1 n/a (227) ;mRNA; f:30828-31508
MMTILPTTTSRQLLLPFVRQRRFFFASSTDHTTLLQNAVVHRLDHGQYQEYVMAAEGMEPEMVQKVPQLHLARLFRRDTVLYGAKVVNSTLGVAKDVCGQLVDAALEDTKGGATAPVKAKSTLTGLSAWVLASSSSSLQEQLQLPESTWNTTIIQEIANGTDDESTYQKGQDAWEQLAQAYIQAGLAEEASLYQSKGATLEAILHRQDTSDYSDSSGGAMASFVFP